MTEAGELKSGSNPEEKGILVGADGFLFHRFEHAFEQLCSAEFPLDRDLAHWLGMIETNFSWCAAKKAAYVMLVVPERHVIYADKLPADHVISQRRPAMRLMESIDPAMRSALLYPISYLCAAREHAEVFLFTDEHLNLRGHYVCYHALLASFNNLINMSPLPEETLAVRQMHVSGNLGMMLDEEPMEDRGFWQLRSDSKAKRIYRHRGRGGRVEVFHHQDSTLPKAIIFGDSHIDELHLILAQNFSRLVVVFHCQRLFYDLVRSERPDFVFHVLAELRLGRPCIDSAVSASSFDFLSYCGEFLPSGTTLINIDFREGGNSQEFIGEGWSHSEVSHTWMVGTVSTLTLPPAISLSLASLDVDQMLTIHLWPFTPRSADGQSQRLIISYGSERAWNELHRSEIEGEVALVIPLPKNSWAFDREVWLKFDHPDSLSPSVVGSIDGRDLAFAVKQLRISPMLKDN